MDVVEVLRGVVEDARLLRGAGRYMDDVNADGQAYGYVLRSSSAHARLEAVDAAAARARTGRAGGTDLCRFRERKRY